MLYIQFPFRLVRVELVITRNGNRLPGNGRTSIHSKLWAYERLFWPHAGFFGVRIDPEKGGNEGFSIFPRKA